MVLVCALGPVSIGHAQYGGGVGGGVVGGGIGGGGMGSTPGTAFGGAGDPGAIEITKGFRLVPTIAAMERYDSNVYLAPKTPGLDRSDYVSTLLPQIRGLFAESGMTLNASVGAIAEYYVKNTNLNYVGVNAGLALNLGSILDPLWRGMQVTITDGFSYTPVPPSFLVGDQTGGSSNLLVNGQQPQRVSSMSNYIATTLTAPVSQTLSLTGSYQRGFIRFGESKVQQIGTLLNTSYQTFTVGMRAALSPRDSVTLSYLNSSSKYEQAGAGSFTSRGGTFMWMHVFSPNVMLTSTAGVQVLDTGSIGSSSAPATTSSTGGSGNTSVSSSIEPRGAFVLTWKDQTTSLFLNYQIDLTPSYQYQPQPLLTNIVSFSVAQVMPIPQFTGLLAVNYARGDGIGATSTNTISYSSYGASGGMVYRFTPKTILGLNYQYAMYDSQFGAQGTTYARNLVLLSLTQALY